MGEVDDPGCCMSLVPAADVGGEGALRLLLSLSLLMSRPLPPEAVRNVAVAAAVIAGEREDEVVSVVLERSFDKQPDIPAIMIQNFFHFLTFV